jgi:hypothetical protein
LPKAVSSSFYYIDPQLKNKGALADRIALAIGLQAAPGVRAVGNLA